MLNNDANQSILSLSVRLLDCGLLTAADHSECAALFKRPPVRGQVCAKVLSGPLAFGSTGPVQSNRKDSAAGTYHVCLVEPAKGLTSVLFVRQNDCCGWNDWHDYEKGINYLSQIPTSCCGKYSQRYRLGHCSESELETRKGCNDLLLQNLEPAPFLKFNFAYVLVSLPFNLIQIVVGILAWKLAGKLKEDDFGKSRLEDQQL